MGSIENLTATLTVDGNVYSADFTQVTSGSSLYESYGAGWTGSFRDAGGNSPLWLLAGGVFSYKEMTLTVSGTNTEPAAVMILTSATSAD